MPTHFPQTKGCLKSNSVYVKLEDKSTPQRVSDFYSATRAIGDCTSTGTLAAQHVLGNSSPLIDTPGKI